MRLNYTTVVTPIAIVLFALMISTTVSEADLKNNAVVMEPHGIRYVFNDAEFFFNATNGGEITEYYDLSVDPSRSRNLANITLGGDFQNLWPLFASGLYNKYADFFPLPDYATGGDTNADVKLILESADNVIIYTGSKLVNLEGSYIKDSKGFPVYINTTWNFDKKTGFIFVDRTFNIKTTLNMPAGWRLYSFYMTRTTGFTYNGTYYLFNSTQENTTIVNRKTYQNRYKSYSVFPMGEDGVFGIAAPFANTSIGGDGAHNMVVTYYNKLIDIDPWICDCFNIGEMYDFSEWGPAYQFPEPVNLTTHTYYAVVHFTHQSVNEKNVLRYAKYVASHYPLMEINLTSDKDVYHPGEQYIISVSGISYQNLTNISSKLTAVNDTDIYFEKYYMSHNYTEGETLSYTLFNGYIRPDEPPGNRTFTMQFISETGAIIASDSKTVSIVPAG